MDHRFYWQDQRAALARAGYGPHPQAQWSWLQDYANVCLRLAQKQGGDENIDDWAARQVKELDVQVMAYLHG
jgi:hypothetical protein